MAKEFEIPSVGSAGDTSRSASGEDRALASMFESLLPSSDGLDVDPVASGVFGAAGIKKLREATARIKQASKQGKIAEDFVEGIVDDLELDVRTKTNLTELAKGLDEQERMKSLIDKGALRNPIRIEEANQKLVSAGEKARAAGSKIVDQARELESIDRVPTPKAPEAQKLLTAPEAKAPEVETKKPKSIDDLRELAKEDSALDRAAARGEKRIAKAKDIAGKPVKAAKSAVKLGKDIAASDPKKLAKAAAGTGFFTRKGIAKLVGGAALLGGGALGLRALTLPDEEPIGGEEVEDTGEFDDFLKDLDAPTKLTPKQKKMKIEKEKLDRELEELLK